MIKWDAAKATTGRSQPREPLASIQSQPAKKSLSRSVLLLASIADLMVVAKGLAMSDGKGGAISSRPNASVVNLQPCFIKP